MKFKPYFEFSEDPRKIYVTIYSTFTIVGRSQKDAAMAQCKRRASEWSSNFKKQAEAKGLTLHANIRPCKVKIYGLETVVYATIFCKFASACDKALFLLGFDEGLELA